jgi:hypothetical protein
MAFTLPDCVPMFLHELIQRADLIMPWAVQRFSLYCTMIWMLSRYHY